MHGGYLMILFRMLLEHPGITVDGRDATGATALHWACSNGDVDTVAELVKAHGWLCVDAIAWMDAAACCPC